MKGEGEGEGERAIVELAQGLRALTALPDLTPSAGFLGYCMHVIPDVRRTHESATSFLLLTGSRKTIRSI